MRLRTGDTPDQIELYAHQHRSDEIDHCHTHRRTADDQRSLHAAFAQKAHGNRQLKSQCGHCVAGRSAPGLHARACFNFACQNHRIIGCNALQHLHAPLHLQTRAHRNPRGLATAIHQHVRRIR